MYAGCRGGGRGESGLVGVRLFGDDAERLIMSRLLAVSVVRGDGAAGVTHHVAYRFVTRRYVVTIAARARQGARRYRSGRCEKDLTVIV